MAAGATNYTAADEPEPSAKKQKIDDDIPTRWKAGQQYRFLDLQNKMDMFRMVCHRIKSLGMSKKEALKPFCMSWKAYTEMNKHIREIEVVIENHPYLLFHYISISEILGIYENIQAVINDVKKILSTEQEAAEKSFTKNAELISKLLLEVLRVPQGCIVVDLTNGLGQFTFNVRHLYEVIRVDKYKNCIREPVDFNKVLGYESPEFTNMLGKKRSTVVIFDPPYQTMSGGYNLHNCNIDNSSSRIDFNDRYGVSFTYTATMIHCFYLKGFELAKKLLAPGGFFLVKLMNENRQDDLRKAVLDLAQHCGFKQKDDAFKVVSGNGQPSYLFVFVQRGSKDTSFADLYLPGNQARSYDKEIKSLVKLRTGEEYAKKGRMMIAKSNEWIGYLEKLSDALSEKEREQAEEDIPSDITDADSRFKGNEEKFKSLFQEGVELNEDSWEELQTMCIELNSNMNGIITMNGLLFEQLLKKKGINIECDEMEEVKRALEVKTIGKNVLVHKRSHRSLSTNIIRLRERYKHEKETQLQRKTMDNYFFRR